MENAPEPGPAKKPRSTTPRTPAARKPATTRKPAAKTTAKPAAKTTAKPAVKATAKPAPKRPATPRAKPATAAKPAAIEVEAVETSEIVAEDVVETPELVVEDVAEEVETPEVVEEVVAEEPETPEDVVEEVDEAVETPEDVVEEAEEPLEAEDTETPEVVAEDVETPEVIAEADDAATEDEVLESETELDEPESAFDPEVAEDVVEATEVEPETKPEPARVTIGRFSLPKLTLPKLVVPTLGRARVQEPETVEPVEVAEDVASDVPEIDVEAADQAVDESTVVEETVLDEPTIEEAVEDAPLAEDEPVEEQPAEEEPEPESEVIEAVIVEESTTVAKKAPRTKKRTKAETVLRVEGLSKHFDDNIAVDSIDLDVPVGSFYGIVGPNGAGKTTTLSMITGLLRPDAGRVLVHGADVWSDPATAKRNMGVLPDRLRLFDRLTGGQLLHYAGVLRGLDNATVTKRSSDLAGAFGLEDAMGRLVSDYSAGMTKKIALAAAMIHSPRLLVLDEPFESVDPVSAATVTDILKSYAAAGGTVVLSSHSMDLVQRICDNVAVIVHGQLLADGTMDEVRDGQTLEERFVSLVSSTRVEGMEWLHSFSD